MIGLFDSGLGGLFLLKELNKKFPNQSFVYLADKMHFPYGDKTSSFLRSLVRENVEFLMSQGAERVIVACNTASAFLEKPESYPVPVMGVIESALKQAEKYSINKKVGLLATEGTVHSRAFLIKEKALNLNLQIYQQACPLLAPFVEKRGWLMTHMECDGREEEEHFFEWSVRQKGPEKQIPSHSGGKKERVETLSLLLEEYLQPLINKGVDTVIPGCTHYLYLKPAIISYIGKNKKVAGPMDFLIKDLLKREGWLAGEKTDQSVDNKQHHRQKRETGENPCVFTNSRDRDFEEQCCRIWGSPIKINKVFGSFS